ncbi:MAG: amidase [Dehalococcoidia bacterium]
MPEPYQLTVTEALAEIGAGRLSPSELVESLLARIEQFDSSIHAWVRLDKERARAAAEERAIEIAQGHVRGPLEGIPLGVKDIYHTAGLATEAGSPLLAGFVPDSDADCVAQLRRAGAIILGKTETTQFALGDPAPTRNPWNLSHTPGGSSSGSAAAVAARMVPAALGSQTAGSILRPAAYCGVVGFKPSWGRFSLRGVIPLAWSLDHAGLLTRSVADARLLFAVLDLRDHVTVQPSPGETPAFGLLRGSFIERADRETLANLEDAAGRLARAGARLREVQFPEGFDLARDVHHSIMLSEASAFHAARHAVHPEAYRPRLRSTIEAGALIPAAAYLHAQRLRSELKVAATGLFDQVDCLLMPSAPSVAPAGLESTGDPSFNAPWSLFGFPAIALPSGMSDSGLPHSLQIIGPAMEDALVLAAAAWAESVLGYLTPRPHSLGRKGETTGTGELTRPSSDA